MAQRKG